MSWLDALLGGQTIYSNGTQQTSRDGLNFIGLTLGDDSTNDWTTIQLPIGAEGQILEHDGTSYVAVSDYTMSNSGDRTITVASDSSASGKDLTISGGGTTFVGGSGGNLTLQAGASKPSEGDDNGTLYLEDGDENVAMTVGGQPEGATEASLSFYGVTPVIRATGINWNSGTPSSAQIRALFSALVDTGIIDGAEIVS